MSDKFNSESLFTGKGNIKLEINYFDFIDNVPKEDVLELVESLSCNEDMINYVVDQIFDGWTRNNGSHGSIKGEIHPQTALELARQRVCNEANWLLRKENERLKRLCESKQKMSDEGWNKYHDLCNQVFRG
ncbi:MAG: hypothetical protein GY861_04700 [bacterium]|nr:hypothetical protein [bacterium]